MKRTNRFTAGGPIVALIALIVGVAGCGVSTGVVTDALPARTTLASTTTEAPTTTGAPTTTETTTTTVAPSTTEAAPDSTAGGGTGSLPAEARATFMNECQSGGQDEATCTCIWNAIEGELDVDALMEAGSSGSLPPDLQKKIVDATMGCMFNGQ
jgi:hypothetical protein